MAAPLKSVAEGADNRVEAICDGKFSIGFNVIDDNISFNIRAISNQRDRLGAR